MHPKTFGAAFAVSVFTVCALRGQTLYNFGNPTADEQQYIEFINRARANPPAEGTRLANTNDPDVVDAYGDYSVNLTMMQNEFNAIAVAPPLAPNANLTTVSRSHSNWMLANATQSHNEGAVTFNQRMNGSGYGGIAYAENIFAYSKSPWHGHAGLNVDWGSGGTGGMQAGRGHRTNIHNSALKEIGVGMTYGINGNIGPQLVTQDFGTRSNTSFATGVAYYDLNGNNFYDAGEGISGLNVNVSGASYYCQTATGGGWAVPVPTSAATRTVTFSGSSINQSESLAIEANKNAKLDLKLSYAAPVLTTPPAAYVGSPYTVNFTAVPGAASYRWKRWTTPAASAENAENANKITSSLVGGYNVLSTGVKQQGTSSFHLVNGAAATQWIELTPLYRGQASAALSFQSCLRVSTTAEQYKVQVKEDGSSAWVDVDSQPGAGGGASGAGFASRNVSLASMANKNFRIRFLLNFSGGSYYPNQYGNSYGWFIDAISFTNIQELQNETVTTLAGTTGTITPAATGSSLHAIYPVISNLDFPPAVKTVTVQASLPAGFATWASTLESGNSLPAGTLANPDADYDKDGQANLVEYAFGTSPVLAAESRTRYPVASKSGSTIVVNYQVDTSLTDLTYVAEASMTLASGSWRTPGQAGAPAGFTDQLVSTNGSIQSRKATIPLSAGARVLFRVRVVQNP